MVVQLLYATLLYCLAPQAWARGELPSLAGTQRRAVPTVQEVQQDLGARLSPNASLWFPGSPQFANDSSRWNKYATGGTLVVVDVATAEDVSQAVRTFIYGPIEGLPLRFYFQVKFANRKHLPFLARNQGHGNIKSLRKIEDGVLIHTAALKHMELVSNESAVKLGGGINDQELWNFLVSNGKESGKLCLWLLSEFQH